MMKLKNRVVVITGASQGLGKVVAYKVAKEGAKVALVARTENLLKEVKEKINKDRGEAEYFICDIRNPNAIKKTVRTIFEKFKTVDILVNNAGVWSDEELEIIKPEGRKNVLETNALGHINFTYEVLPYFKKQKKGYIFNVISTSGVGDIPDGNNVMWKSYGASKWAMSGFTKALRDELKDTKIKVTGFFPGGFESNLYENAGRQNPHSQPWMMKTEDVADVVLFSLTRPDDVMIERVVVAKVF